MNWYFNTHVALKPKGSHDTYPLLPWSVGLLTGTLTSSVCAGSKGADDGLQAAMDKFEAAGGYDADKRIANVLTGLGFKQEEWNKSCSEFSGGWQVRLLQTKLYPCMHACRQHRAHAQRQHNLAMHRDSTTLPCMEATRPCVATPHLCMLTAANGSVTTCVLLRRAGRHWNLLLENCSCSLSSEKLW